jgi:hypothetical protein
MVGDVWVQSLTNKFNFMSCYMKNRNLCGPGVQGPKWRYHNKSNCQGSIYVINWGSSFLYFMPFCLLLCCRLRGTTLGANNRMDLLSLSTSKVNSDGIIEPGEDILGPVELQETVISRISHQRGLAPFAFVPFEEVCTEPNVWSIKSCRVLS